MLCAVRHYLPGYWSGGPVRSLSRMVEELGGAFDVRIVCLDRDSGMIEPYADIDPRCWTRVGKAQVMYVPPSGRTLRFWRRVFDEVRPDLLYVNSLFDPWFSMQPVWQARRLRIPTVVAPRGELSAGALAQKRVKKYAAGLVFRLSSLHRDVRWHACSTEEAADIRTALGVEDFRIATVPNLPGVVPLQGVSWPQKSAGSLRVMFFSRIAPKKNLLGAIRSVLRVGGGVLLDIWGPLEDQNYVRICRKEIEAAPSGATVSWRGPIPHEEVPRRMAEYDVFLLPTLGENFGHVIFEALASGVPVLVSDKTPWRDLRTLGVGVDLPAADEEGFAAELRRFRDMDAPALQAFRRRCVSFADDWSRNHPGGDAYRRLWDIRQWPDQGDSETSRS